MENNFMILTEAKMRQPKATDRLKVKIIRSDARRYAVENLTAGTIYFVQLARINNQNMGNCTCPDFANSHKHGMACKHIRVAAAVHISRRRAELLAVAA